MDPSSTSPMDSPPSEDAGDLITVLIDEEFAAQVDGDDLATAVLATLEAEGRAGEATVVVTSDEAVAELNERYRDVTGPTDVLSFPAQEETPDFVTAPEMSAYLGDIIIALPYTQRQAASLNRPLAAELRLLAVHGALHLLGYDHAEPEEEAEMWARQDAILARLP